MLLTQLAGGRREHFTIMESTISSSVMEEFELMKQAKYRVYLQNIDKSLKNFEYSSEWADLISALGKLNKVSQTFKVFVVDDATMSFTCKYSMNILFSLLPGYFELSTVSGDTATNQNIKTSSAVHASVSTIG